MPRTVPNQRLIAIHRERAATDFLGIKNSHWQAAARDLGAHALMLYLYFASNANGFCPLQYGKRLECLHPLTAINLYDLLIKVILCSGTTAILMISMKHLNASHIIQQTIRLTV